MWRRRPVGLTMAVIAVSAALSAQSAPPLPNPFKSVENYFKAPDGRKLGAITGVQIDRDGSSVWLADRCGTNTCEGSTVDSILKFDSSGKFVKSFGGGMFLFPHGLFVDKEGNIWVTDGHGGNGKGHQVFKFNPDGKVLLTLGKAGVASDAPDTFNMPSDVVIASNGDIFVADGHGGNTNHRVVKFSKDGKFIKAWGQKGSGPSEFDTLHAMAIDSSDRIYIADRGNKRIQVFDKNGTFVADWKQFGEPDGVFIDKKDILYASGESASGAEGVSIGSVKDGKVTAFVPNGGGTIENVAVNQKGVLYAIAGVAGIQPTAQPLRIFVRQ